MPSVYKFGVELEMLLRLRHPIQDVDTQKINQDDLIKVADYIAKYYNSAIQNWSSSGSSGTKYPAITRRSWERQAGEPGTWEIHNEPSLYLLGINQCRDCM